MPRIPSVLTDTVVRQIPTKDKEQLISDGGFIGLHVHVAKNTGRKTWRVRLMQNGKILKTERVGSFEVRGASDNLTVKEARLAADKIKQAYFQPDLVVAPVVVKSFAEVAAEWQAWYLQFEKPTPATLKKHNCYLNNDILPILGKRDFYRVTRDDCKALLLGVFNRTPAGANNTRQLLNMIFDYGTDNFGDKSPTFSLKKVFHYDKKKSDFVMPADIVEEYKKCNSIQSDIMRLACKIQHHVFLRAGEIISTLDENTDTLHGAEWTEIDWKNKLWHIPPLRMKMKLPHSVPLSTQVIKLLQELKTMTADSPYLFPSTHGKYINQRPMVRDNLSKVFRENAIPYYPHSCRKLAGDWMKQQGVERDVVEIQLAHILGNNAEQAYSHAPHLYYLEKRRAAMQLWSDFLEAPQAKTETETASASDKSSSVLNNYQEMQDKISSVLNG